MILNCKLRGASLCLAKQIPHYIDMTFITSYDVHLSYCMHIVVCSVFINMLLVLVFLSDTECLSSYYHFRCDYK